MSAEGSAKGKCSKGQIRKHLRTFSQLLHGAAQKTLSLAQNMVFLHE
jgi:hypothetical protein